MENHLNRLNALIHARALAATITYDASVFEGSDINPLTTLRLATFDPAQGEAMSPEDCGAITGLPASVFETTTEAPVVSGADLERALGRLALAWLASIRNQLAEEAGLQGRESLTTAALGLLYVRTSPIRAAERRAA